MSDWPGLGPAVSAGEAWTVLGTVVLGSPASSMTITGIAAASAPRMRSYLYAIHDNASVAASTDVSLAFNNDTTAANYDVQQLHAVGTSLTGAQYLDNAIGRQVSVKGLMGTGVGLFITYIAKPVAGEVCRFHTINAEEGVGDPGYWDRLAHSKLGNEWSNTSALISEIDMTTSANNFDTGTRWVLEGKAT